MIRIKSIISFFRWQGMKTVAEIKKDRGIRNEVKEDHLYREVTQRREYVNLPLKVPKDLMKALPYNAREKVRPSSKGVKRVVVVKDPNEVQMDAFMSRLKVLMKDRTQKQAQKKRQEQAKYRTAVAAREKKGMEAARRRKAAACRKMGKYGKKKG